MAFGDKSQQRGPLRRIDKSKVLSLLLHAADISHPTKQWAVHSRWTKALMEEFFRQVGSPRPWGQGDNPLGTHLPRFAFPGGQGGRAGAALLAALRPHFNAGGPVADR